TSSSNSSSSSADSELVAIARKNASVDSALTGRDGAAPAPSAMLDIDCTPAKPPSRPAPFGGGRKPPPELMPRPVAGGQAQTGCAAPREVFIPAAARRAHWGNDDTRRPQRRPGAGDAAATAAAAIPRPDPANA